MKKIRFAVIGFGRIGKRHAAIIANHPDCELVAIIDTEHESTSDAEYPGNIPFFHDMATMAREINADVLSVCTPNGLHVQHAREGIRAGMDVIIEKPMGLTYVSCLELIAEAKELGRQLFVVKQNRYSPPVKWVKEMVDSGKLGKIYLVQINCFWNRNEQYYNESPWKGNRTLDGGVLFTQFSHFIDIMYWLFGDIEDISGTAENFSHRDSTDFADTGALTFRFHSGGIGGLQFSTSVWDRNMESAIRIVAEKGSIVLGGQYMNDLEYVHIENETLPDLPPTNPPNLYGKYSGSAANHHFVIQNVVDVLNGVSSPTTTSDDGAKVVDIIERMQRVLGAGNR